MAEEVVGQAAEGDKKIVHTYPLVKVSQNERNEKQKLTHKTPIETIRKQTSNKYTPKIENL